MISPNSTAIALNQPIRDKLAADVAEWVAKNGEPPLIPAGVSVLDTDTAIPIHASYRLRQLGDRSTR